jgi:putative transposase
MVERESEISIRRQCHLLSVPRRSYYYKFRGESDYNRELMKLIDEQYLKDPTYGSRRMTAHLRRKGYRANRKRVMRLMRKMNIRAIYREPRTSIPPKEAPTTQNLVEKLKIDRPNQVWYTDITYVRVPGGFCYTVAIMDAYSKKVLSMKHSNTLDRIFCVEAAEEAVNRYGHPEIIHADRGKQFLSRDFLKVFRDDTGREVSKASFGKKGYRDNIYVERFWRTYKYECLYLQDINSPKDVKEVSRKWIEYYNGERLHQSLGYRTPDEVYYQKSRLTMSDKIVVQN